MSDDTRHHGVPASRAVLLTADCLSSSGECLNDVSISMYFNSSKCVNTVTGLMLCDHDFDWLSPGHEQMVVVTVWICITVLIGGGVHVWSRCLFFESNCPASCLLRVTCYS
jgi:hypothetical protein